MEKERIFEEDDDKMYLSCICLLSLFMNWGEASLLGTLI